jgi:membrane protein DedA with SNARE-associated domain
MPAYAALAGIIGAEPACVPVPGETTLLTSSALAAASDAPRSLARPLAQATSAARHGPSFRWEHRQSQLTAVIESGDA